MTDPSTTNPTDPALEDRLTLADWRRRVAALYVEVRAMAVSDPAIALGHWRAVRERLYREHPQSPVPVDQRSAFRALHFDHDPRLRFQAIVEPAAPAAPGALALDLPNSGVESLAFRRVGTVRLPFADGERRLSVFWLAGYAGGLFIPFRDATNGTSTYGAGRYIDPEELGGGKFHVDFNAAYNPTCVYGDGWSCPITPAENRLKVVIKAGEKMPSGEWAAH